MKKKYVIGGSLIVVVIFLFCIVVTNKYSTKNTYNKYFIINEGLYIDNKTYAKADTNIAALTLGKQIGITDEKQQIYEIKGLDSDEWICVRSDGIEYLYQDINKRSLSFDRLTASKILIKDEGTLGGEQTSITDHETISKIISYINEKNLVNMPETVSTAKQVNLEVKEYSGLYFILYYLHNETDGCFLYNPYTEETWSIGEEIMMQL